MTCKTALSILQYARQQRLYALQKRELLSQAAHVRQNLICAYGRQRVSGGRRGDNPAQSMLERVEALSRAVEKQELAARRAADKAERLLVLVPEKDAAILMDYYILALSVKDICIKRGLDRSECRTAINSALRKLYRKLRRLYA